MQFYEKQEHKPAIIIIALIDVLVILLIFFTVSTTFIQHPAVQLALPSSKTGEEVSREQGLVLTIGGDEKIFLNLEPIALKALPDKLKAAKAKNPKATLELRADRKVSFGTIIQVMDAAKEANLATINAFTERVRGATP